MTRQFLRYCIVGAAGFVVDAGILEFLVKEASADPYLARVFSFLSAASVTWLMNRRYTFRVVSQATSAEWRNYVGLMVIGAGINFGMYSACFLLVAVVQEHLWIGVAAGSVAGLVVNFMSSRAQLARKLSAKDSVSPQV